MSNKLAYLYIKAWGMATNSFDYYINHQIELAQFSNAPEKAVYKCDDGSWVTIDDCVESTRQQIEAIVNRLKGV